VRLDEFKADKGLTIDEVAALLEVPRPTAWSWISGRRTPRYGRMLEIDKATRGQVTVCDWAHTVGGHKGG
jgi:DNA-binding transcriptional regulator YdaS (Cro superfamily)